LGGRCPSFAGLPSFVVADRSPSFGELPSSALTVGWKKDVIVGGWGFSGKVNWVGPIEEFLSDSARRSWAKGEEIHVDAHMRGDDYAVALWDIQYVTALTDAGGEADDDAVPSDNPKLGVFTCATISPSKGLGSEGNEGCCVYGVLLVEDNVGWWTVCGTESVEAVYAELDGEEPQVRWGLAGCKVGSRKSCDGSYCTFRETVRLWCVSVCKGLMNVELIADVLESLGLEFEALI